MLRYKGYAGQVVYDDAAMIFHGEVVDLRDVVTFQGRTVEDLEQAFRDSVDDYLDFCAERGEEPDKPFSGRFMLRLPPDLHRKAYIRAKKVGKSLNQWISDRLDEAITPPAPPSTGTVRPSHGRPGFTDSPCN